MNNNYQCHCLLMIFCVTIMVLFSSCERNPITNEDTAGIEIRMRNSNNGGGALYLLHVDSACYNGGYLYSEVELGIDKSDNFCVYSDYDNSRYEVNSDCGIVCVGSVNGLSQIKNIPNAGWANKVSVKPGYGYIIRLKNPEDNPYEYYNYSHYCRYARIYVVNWIEGTSGGILGATIRYEDNWKIED